MPQVNIDHYKWQYFTRPRFIMYHGILQILSEIEFKSVLELGPGPGILSYILKFLDKDVITFDFDKNLYPDVVGDIRNLPFKKGSFDLVLACQIFEHIPYNQFLSVLRDINKISKSFFLFSVPYNQHHFEFFLNIKIIKYLYFRGFLNKILNKIFPIYTYFGKDLKTSFPKHEEHFWEIGYKGYSIQKIRKDISRNFEIHQEGRIVLAPYYYYFLCCKK